MKTTRKVSGAEVTCDRIAAALVDRLVATEKRLDALQAEVAAIYEELAECSAWYVPGVGLRFGRVLEHENASADPPQRTVIVKEIALSVAEEQQHE